jgi:HTH-type transcriptional regulator/antitoxin HipB
MGQKRARRAALSTTRVERPRKKRTAPLPELAVRLRALRVKAGLTQVMVAEKVGGSQSMVAYWESGRSEPTIRQAEVLAKAFGVSLSLLLTGKEGK